MAEYRNGYKVDPATGLTKQEERAGLTTAEAEAGASAAPAGRVPLLSARACRSLNVGAASPEPFGPSSRSVCEAADTYLATEDMHGFSDQATELFGASDAAKSATGAGLAYIDTLAPSKLADFQRHVQDASAYYTQSLTDLNARLSELGVAHVS